MTSLIYGLLAKLAHTSLEYHSKETAVSTRNVFFTLTVYGNGLRFLSPSYLGKFLGVPCTVGTGSRVLNPSIEPCTKTTLFFVLIDLILIGKLYIRRSSKSLGFIENNLAR